MINKDDEENSGAVDLDLSVLGPIARPISHLQCLIVYAKSVYSEVYTLYILIRKKNENKEKQKRKKERK